MKGDVALFFCTKGTGWIHVKDFLTNVDIEKDRTDTDQPVAMEAFKHELRVLQSMNVKVLFASLQSISMVPRLHTTKCNRSRDWYGLSEVQSQPGSCQQLAVKDLNLDII